jgi:hypothetical protein
LSSATQTDKSTLTAKNVAQPINLNNQSPSLFPTSPNKELDNKGIKNDSVMQAIKDANKNIAQNKTPEKSEISKPVDVSWAGDLIDGIGQMNNKLDSLININQKMATAIA